MMGMDVRGHGHGWGRVLAAAFLALALAGASGCSLLTPSRADVVPDPTRAALSAPSIATNGVLTVGIDASDAPQVMTDSSGRLTGYTADVARALGRKLGLKVAFSTDSYAKDAGSTGGPDIYLGATSADASDDIAVSGSYLESAPALFTKVADGSPSATGSALAAESLAGATVAVQTGSNAADVLTKSGITATQKPYANINECFKALTSGEVQYVACEATAGAYLARAYAGVRFAGAIDAPTSYGVAVRVTNAGLAEAVDGALKELAQDGTLDAIHAAWYGSLPSSLTDSLVSGISTSADREKAEQDRKAEEEAKKKQQEEAAANTGDASSASDDASASDTSDAA